MSGEADAIVIGEQLDGDRVTVTKWIHGAPDPAPATIVITDLGKLTKTLSIWSLPRGETKPADLHTRRFVAFLTHGRWTWQSMGTIEDFGETGSCGLMWMQDGRYYQYEQINRPGGYHLMPADDFKTETDLMKAIEVGRADEIAWQKVRQIGDVAARVQALTAYTLASTSPEGSRLTHCWRARYPLQKLGAAAVVPALRQQLTKWQAGESLEDIVEMLADFGPAAQAAVPDLVALLKQPERVRLSCVIRALGEVGDSSCLATLRPYLKHSDEHIGDEAAHAIRALNIRAEAARVGSPR